MGFILCTKLDNSKLIFKIEDFKSAEEYDLGTKIEFKDRSIVTVKQTATEIYNLIKNTQY